MKKIAVVGLGAIGAQVFWQLSKLGLEVHGFERHTPGHGFGASGGDGRLFRKVQYEAEDYVPLLTRSESIWEELEQESQQQLRVISGGMILGAKTSAQIQTALSGVGRFSLATETYGATELRELFPFQQYHEDDVGILDHGAGIIRPELTNIAAITAAVSRGGVLHKKERIVGIEPGSSTVRISSAEGNYTFDHVVVTTGAWISQLSEAVGSLVQPRKVISAWYYPKVKDALRQIPAFVRTSPTHYYGVPSQDGLSIKLGLSGVNHMDVTTPDDADYVVRDVNYEKFGPLLDDYFPGLIPEPFRLETYFEGYTDDARPIMQHLDDSATVSVLAGFSGHGFKFAPFYGLVGAKLAADGESDPDVAFLHRAID